MSGSINLRGVIIELTKNLAICDYAFKYLVYESLFFKGSFGGVGHYTTSKFFAE